MLVIALCAATDFWGRIRVARPFWFRLFGPNGPTTLAEFRAALMTAPLGETIGEGRRLAQLQTLLNLPAHMPERPGPGPDQNSDFGLHEQVFVATAVITEHDLAAAPAPLAGGIATPSPEDAAVNLAGSDTGRDASLYLNGVVPNHALAGDPRSPFAHLDMSAPYMLLGDMQSGLIVDTHNKTLMQGGPGDYPEFGVGPYDTVELTGDYSAGFGLGTPDYVEQVLVRAGNDYNLIADDSNVAAGGALTINAIPLGDANSIIFDGSAETDGRFTFYGSDAADVFLGGAGDDIVYGHGGGDVLSGGGGGDTFAYFDVSQSAGADYDTLADFDPGADKIDLDVTVTGFDAAVQGGTLSAGSFDDDLGAALAGLGAGHAMVYAPDAGDLAGTVFLIVDANGKEGYQAGEDYVFALPATTLADLSAHPGFFI
jgi:Ca2+-binding RTX toxin-like protein